MRNYIISTITLLLFSVSIFSKVEVIDVTKAKSAAGKQQIIIHHKGELIEVPRISTRKKMVQLELSDTIVWPKIEKKASFYDKYDTKLMAYQFNKHLTRVRAVLPYSVIGLESRIQLHMKPGRIILEIPGKQSIIGRSPAIQKTAEPKVAENTKYDESFLDQLLNEKELKKDQNEVKELSKKLAVANKLQNQVTDSPKTIDKVNLTLSSNKKSTKSSFSVMSYLGKFIAFLAIVLCIFYGVAYLIKKGALGKNKLGFLNSTKVVEVLNTTYISPKRSMLIIRAHKQIFLVGSSEKGMHMISELTDVSGLMKDGEKSIAGSNFDSTMFDANEEDKEFKLKEILDSPAIAAAKPSSTNEAKDKVKFSEQIRDKVKKLKSLQ